MLFHTFPPLDRKESNPSHEFAGDRKNLLASTFRFDDIGQTNRMTYFLRFAIHLSLVIFSVYSYFLLVCLLSVLFVCFSISCSYFLIK